MKSWQAFTDHKVVTAHSTYQLGRQSEEKENVHLLEIGGKLKQLDFHKADWCSVKSELGNIDWSTMEEVEPVIALKMFFELVLPVLERTVPKKVIHNKSRSRPKMDRKRRLLCKRLVKAKSKIQQAATINQVMKFMQNNVKLLHNLCI